MGTIRTASCSRRSPRSTSCCCRPGESNRHLIDAPCSPLASDWQRCRYPRRLNKTTVCGWTRERADSLKSLGLRGLQLSLCGGALAAAAVSHSCACIGSPCLRHCVHGASIGGQRRRGGERPGVGRRFAGIVRWVTAMHTHIIRLLSRRA
jgi:hypothetical protein